MAGTLPPPFDFPEVSLSGLAFVEWKSNTEYSKVQGTLAEPRA